MQMPEDDIDNLNRALKRPLSFEPVIGKTPPLCLPQIGMFQVRRPGKAEVFSEIQQF